MKTIEMYCSGWSIGNPSKKTGAGIILVYGETGREISTFIGDGTANSCFLAAMVIGLQALSEPCNVTIYCHNQIIVNGANNQNATRANPELWIDYRYQELIHNVKVIWIKKDSHKHNTRSSLLAKQAAREGGYYG